jgi:AraC-like DNA-binding protein
MLMKALLENLATALTPLITGEGVRATRLAGVRLMHTQHRFPRAPISYEPKIVILARGTKVAYFGGERIAYGAGNYLVVGAPLPFECETHGTPKEPLLGLSISLTPAVVTGLLMQLKTRPPVSVNTVQVMRAATVTPELLDAATRLAQALASDEEAEMLGNGLVREIIYRVLKGPLGSEVAAVGLPPAHFAPVRQALELISHNTTRPFSVAELAQASGLGVSVFHQRFKEVMRVTPQQYVKQTRLHQARMLMVHDGLPANLAAVRVGYQSPTQFSREFRRLFGGTPAEVAKAMREGGVRLEP